MKITEIETFLARIPFKKQPALESLRDSTATVIIKVSTDKNIIGWGEAAGFSLRTGVEVVIQKTIQSVFKPLLIGKNPTEISQRWEELYRTSYAYGRSGIALFCISALEMALWDIKGKSLNAPVYLLLGGLKHKKIAAYASLYPYADKNKIAAACETVLTKGYTAIKLHEKDYEVMAAARQAIGNEIKLMIDVNYAFDFNQAVALCKRLEALQILWIEEPIWPPDDYESMAKLQAKINIPIATGENEYTARGFKALIKSRVVKYIQPCVTKIGGIEEMKKVFKMIEETEQQLLPHCFFCGPAMAATLHICFSEADCEMIETRVSADPEANILQEPIYPENGFWYINDKPGFGIEVDEETLARYSFD